MRREVIHATLLISFIGILLPSHAERVPVVGNVCNVTQYGATGKDTEDATAAFRQAVDACASRGGGTVYAGPGKYVSGPIELKDNITFFVDAGATVSLATAPEDFRGKPGSLLY